MYTSITIVAALLYTASAVPVALVDRQSTPTLVTAPLKSGNPFAFPLSNGFNGQLVGDALRATNIQAQGSQPNGGAPTVTADDLTSFQLIAFNEIFEVAFFTSALTNVTNNVPGFITNDNGYTKAALTAIQAQEELHANNANAILKANGKNPIQPCQYKFPTTTLQQAFSLAKTFTDVVMGTLQDVQLHLAQNGAAGVVPVIGSVIGQEGEQTGYFRQTARLVPSELPFLTRATREFAFSALNQMFIVPGSCPNAQEINLPIFKPLTVVTSNIQGQDQTLRFSVKSADVTSLNGLSLVYINGQNVPFVQNISNVSSVNGVISFDAVFPYSENLMNGLTIAALTKSAGPFKTAEDVAKVTIAGPGLIEIN